MYVFFFILMPEFTFNLNILNYIDFKSVIKAGSTSHFVNQYQKSVSVNIPT